MMVMLQGYKACSFRGIHCCYFVSDGDLPSQDLAARLSGEKGQLHPLAADLSREEEVRRVYQWIDDTFGGVSIVVNNAAALTLLPMQGTTAPLFPDNHFVATSITTFC